MRILILEDDPARHKAFKKNLIGNEVLITEHTDQAIKLIKEQDWDVLFLDHDLGGKVYCESGAGIQKNTVQTPATMKVNIRAI